jgi:ABC-type antimicrobial peptide transport system permease subunit
LRRAIRRCSPAASLALGLAACAAVVLPAVRASRIDPVRALRAE